MRIKETAALCLLPLAALVAGTAAAATPLALSKLYASYESADYSALSMPEYDQAVRISAVVLEQNTSLADTALTSATDAGSDVEYARLSSDDPEQSRKLSALEPGTAFVATCTVGFTSGSDYMSLTGCAVE
ncbi:hypothetical protein K4L06_11000 [Lysobacter sp. BMK333-48F3]|uniref:hypothetical protein n=1 Tax=Lysobacter sp. BMK333-48F3 TaxID=2867962 RepID=UPI001C8C31A5|nr:hypothetical protein [Lysobacter sp. BMK333-48F3]MBX9401836.1 hypothetical protein [Lysobacter sp. BMK333-48F3]